MITDLGTLITNLGSPFQAGGSIGNSSFGISGTLPAYASTPTFNLGTLNGAATASLQTTGNTSLSSIDGKTPALGQALAAASVPVVLTAAQVTTLTPPTSVTVTQGTAANLNATVTGTVALGAGSAVIGHVINDASSAVIGHVIADSGSTTAVTSLPATPAGTNLIGKVGIDQTTPGTTNGVQVNAALPAGSNVIGHVINDASSAVIGHVIVDTAPSTAVTNAGTFAVQATPVVPTALTVHQAAITIGTSAVRLTYNGSAAAATRVLLVAQLLSSSTANCFFGSSGVTTTSTTRGVQMFAGQVFSFNNDAGDYYAICDASSQTFLITEQE